MSKFQIPLGRLLDLEPLSVVDIGSNSVRLVVYEGAKRSPAVIFNEKILCALGKSVGVNGLLSEESMNKALEALRRFRAVSQNLGATKIYAIATAAARDASNGPAFIKQAEEILGYKIEVLSGDQEAKLAATGVMSGMMNADGFVADMGGGSIEITNLSKQKTYEVTSLPIGALRLLQSSAGDYEQAEKAVEKELQKIKWLKKGKNRFLYLVGGTWRTYAKLHMAHTEYPLKFIDNYRIETDNALNFIDFLKKSDISEINGIDDISKGRKETFIYGACALKELIQKINPSQIIFSSCGVRDGLLYQLLPEKERNKDPLYSACYDLAILRSRSPQNSEELCSWTDDLWESIKIKESERDRNLRHAICLLSDIAWRIHPEYRGLHSINIIAQSSFAGLEHKDRIYIALGVFFRHEGKYKSRMLPEVSNLLKDEEVEKARTVGLAIRLANIISANMPGILQHTPIKGTKNGELILTLPQPYKVLDGERVVRRLTSLAQLLKLQGEIRQS